MYNNKLTQYVVLILGCILIILGLGLSFQGSSANIYVFPIGVALFLALIFLKVITRVF